MELTPLGKISENNSSMELSVIGKYLTIVKRSIMNGKKEMIIKKAACAEYACI
jgi:hypothetical protein